MADSDWEDVTDKYNPDDWEDVGNAVVKIKPSDYEMNAPVPIQTVTAPQPDQNVQEKNFLYSRPGAYGENVLRSGLSGATSGLSEVALNKINPKEQAEHGQFQKLYPKTDITAQVVGALSPVSEGALISKGVGYGAKALGAAVPAASEALANAPWAVRTGAKIAQGAAEGGIGAGAQEALTQAGEKALGTRESFEPQRIKEASYLGAKLGATVPALKGAVETGNWLIGAGKNEARRLAMQGTGMMRGNIPDSVKRSGLKRVEELGDFALQNKLVQSGDNFESIANKAKDLKDTQWQKLDSIYDAATQQLQDPEKLARLGPQAEQVFNSAIKPVEINDQFLLDWKKRLKGEPGSTKALASIQTVVNELAGNVNEPTDVIGLGRAHDIKRSLDKLADYSEEFYKQPLAKQAVQDLANRYRKAIGSHLESLDGVLSTNYANELKQANQNFSKAADIYNIASDRAEREYQKNFLAPSDKYAAGLGALAGGAAGFSTGNTIEDKFKRGGVGAVSGLGLGLVNKFLRPRALPVASQFLYKNRPVPVPAFERIPVGATPLIMNEKERRKKALGGK